MIEQPLPAVVFLHASDELYGADRQLLALVRASQGQCRPIVLLPDDAASGGGLSEELRRDGVEVRHGPLPVLRRRYGSFTGMIRWLPGSIAGLWWVLRTARTARAMAIVSNSTAIPVGPAVAMLVRRPHVWIVREIIQSPAWLRGFVQASARLAEGHVFTVSDAVRTWLGPIRGRGPSTLHDGVPIGMDPLPLPRSPVAMFLGRINEWKGWEIFIEAAGLAHERVPQARFTLVGGVVPGGALGPEAVNQMIVEHDPMGEWLEWVGELRDPKPSIRDAWLVASPSTRPDPFPNVVLEAMSEARAVVGSASGGIPEMVVDGETGFLVRPGDPHALADAMAVILDERALAERFGEAGRRRLISEFSEDRFEQQWRRMMGSIVTTGDRAGA